MVNKKDADFFCAHTYPFGDAPFTDQKVREGASVWLGLPRMDLASLERKLKLIRDIQKARVEAHPGGVYLETTPFLLNTDGELRVYGEVRGKRKTLRADDGIHFTMAGSTFLADAVVGPVLEAFGYEPPEPPTAEDGAGAGSEDG